MIDNISCEVNLSPAKWSVWSLWPCFTIHALKFCQRVRSSADVASALENCLVICTSFTSTYGPRYLDVPLIAHTLLLVIARSVQTSGTMFMIFDRTSSGISSRVGVVRERGWSWGWPRVSIVCKHKHNSDITKQLIVCEARALGGLRRGPRGDAELALVMWRW